MGRNSRTGDETDVAKNYEPIEDSENEAIFGSDSSHETSLQTNRKHNKSKSKNNVIRISSQLELPFSAEIAYEAYSNLPRQPSWSSWLESVELLDENNNNNSENNNNNESTEPAVESLWTSKILGIRYSWTAEAVRNERPHTIQWRSVTGLQNEGIVRFHKHNQSKDGYHQGPTLMTLNMAFCTPRAVSAILSRSRRLSRFVEDTMIAQSLRDFRDVVLEEQRQQQQQQLDTANAIVVQGATPEPNASTLS